MIKKVLIALSILFILIQFIHPEKNLSGDNTNAITTKYNVPPEVSGILEVACYDCHSNTTRYPWYANVQPAAWWLANHVKEGKSELNFSNFTSGRIGRQNRKFKEIAELVKEKKMPLPSYTYFGLHSEVNLTDEQRATLTLWAQSQMELIATQYPADSLVMKRK